MASTAINFNIRKNSPNSNYLSCFRKTANEHEWTRTKTVYSCPSELAAETLAIQHREPPAGWDAAIPTFPPDAKGIASRDSSGKVLNAIAKRHPWLIGGSADLSPSTKTRLTFEGAGEISRDSLGARNVHFGVREHAMGAILNGLALAKLRVFGSGFLIFSDYGRVPCVSQR